jgi:hypothetical protein
MHQESERLEPPTVTGWRAANTPINPSSTPTPSANNGPGLVVPPQLTSATSTTSTTTATMAGFARSIEPEFGLVVMPPIY